MATLRRGTEGKAGVCCEIGLSGYSAVESVDVDAIVFGLTCLSFEEWFGWVRKGEEDGDR